MNIFGILNITPDSFSDGGAHEADYVKAAEQMLSDGAFAIDIGAESTRPGATEITLAEEWKRLQPVLENLTSAILSIDTRNYQTVRQALKYSSVKYINDVSGFHSPEMAELAAASGAHIIVMHSLTIPADKNITLASPVMETIQNWIEGRFRYLTGAGIQADKIIFDPGIGFGKTPQQSKELIDHAAILADICHKLGTKLLYGHSRKSFLGGDIATRDQETAKISRHLQNSDVDYIRVHNIKLNYLELHKQETGN